MTFDDFTKILAEFGLFGLVAVALGIFLFFYVRKKAQNLADINDVEKISKKVEVIKGDIAKDVESVKGDIAIKLEVMKNGLSKDLELVKSELSKETALLKAELDLQGKIEFSSLSELRTAIIEYGSVLDGWIGDLVDFSFGGIDQRNNSEIQQHKKTLAIKKQSQQSKLSKLRLLAKASEAFDPSELYVYAQDLNTHVIKTLSTVHGIYLTKLVSSNNLFEIAEKVEDAAKRTEEIDKVWEKVLTEMEEYHAKMLSAYDEVLIDQNEVRSILQKSLSSISLKNSPDSEKVSN